MAYEIKNDPYLDKDTGILVNKFNIKDQKTLDAVEFELTAAQIASFEEDPVPGNFDLAHLQAIHKQIFGQLYSWAGELRTVDIAKDQTRFAHAPLIPSYAEKLFKELREEHWLKNTDDTQFIERFAYYYSEINLLHPFREGNGRAQRAFMSLLAMYNGYQIQWDQLNQEDNIAASIAAYMGNLEPLEEILFPLLEWVHEDYFYFKSNQDGQAVVDRSLRDWPK